LTIKILVVASCISSYNIVVHGAIMYLLHQQRTVDSPTTYCWLTNKSSE